MSRPYYFPDKKADRIAFLSSFALKLPGYATKFGISAAQIKDMNDSAAYLEYAALCQELTRHHDKALTTYYETLTKGGSGEIDNLPVLSFPAAPVVVPKKGIFVRVLKLVKSIKAHADYTHSDGANMGIEASHSHKVDRNSLQPNLKARIVGSFVEVTAKKGSTQGFEVWADRGTGKFEFIGFATGKKFTDEMPHPKEPQKWSYKSIYHLKNAQAGKWSQVVSVFVGAET